DVETLHYVADICVKDEGAGIFFYLVAFFCKSLAERSRHDARHFVELPRVVVWQPTGGRGIMNGRLFDGREVDVEQHGRAVLCFQATQPGGRLARVAVGGFPVGDVEDQRRERGGMLLHPRQQDIVGMLHRLAHRRLAERVQVEPYREAHLGFHKTTSPVRDFAGYRLQAERVLGYLSDRDQFTTGQVATERGAKLLASIPKDTYIKVL